MRLTWVLFFFTASFVLVACATQPPLKQYTLARTAVQAAKSSQSSKYAPAYWQKCEEYLAQGEALYKKNQYEEAAEKFSLAREYAEKAENVSKVKRFTSGEDLP